MTRSEAARSRTYASDLDVRFSATVKEDAVISSGDRILVALSGGLDSTVLLHLLRFSTGLPRMEIHAAHFDHRMRQESQGDRRWAEGLCRAWEVPCEVGVADSPPSSEDQARQARYEFLLDLKERLGADWLITAHQGDDQVETILFRMVRGTGLKGLAGISTERHPGVYRPLLPFFRAELREYAVDRGIRHRTDPTNQDLAFPRNFLRHRIIPELLRGVATDGRASLLRLARLARENEEGWESLMPLLLEGVWKEAEGGEFIVRSAFLAYHPAVRARLLRRVLSGFGIELDEAGTRAAVEFTSSGASGGSISLPGGVRLTRDFDEIRIRENESSEEGEGHRSLRLETRQGSSELRLGGKRLLVSWGPEVPVGFAMTLGIPVAEVAFPLELRGWEPGDRISLAYGTKKLKKVFSEAKVPVTRRRHYPVLVDGNGRILWVAGLIVSDVMMNTSESDILYLGIRNADGD